jgi:hypothetical protein
MNLFRSEEHVKNWSLYDPASADAIMPLADWALVFSGPLMRNRLKPDYLAHVQEYTPEIFHALRNLGKTGPFWQSS